MNKCVKIYSQDFDYKNKKAVKSVDLFCQKKHNKILSMKKLECPHL